MYLVKKNKVITATRGDYLEIHLELLKGKFPYQEKLTIGDKDLIYFGLMDPNSHFERALVKKELSSADFDSEGNLVITLNVEDTLTLYPGTYFYALKLLKENAEIETILQKTRFNLID